MVGPCGGHARKDGRTGFSSAAPAALQPLRWPHGVLKRCTCRASTFKMAVQGSQALRLPRFNLLDGRTGFSSAAPAALQPLRWPHGVLKRCTCRASTFKMTVQDSQALRLPRFNLLDGRAGFSSAAPVTQTNGICEIIVQTKSPTKPPKRYCFLHDQISGSRESGKFKNGAVARTQFWCCGPDGLVLY